MGVVEEVGAEVRGLQVGDRVVAPFVRADVRAPCAEGPARPARTAAGGMGSDGGQG
ncbi:alcohol dehydrogenase catalytic domain-containing protein [Yinghuangia aomiensis]